MGKTTPGETEGQQVLRGQEPWAPQTHLFPGERDLQPGSTSSPRLAPTSASNPGLYSRIAGQRSLVLVSHAGGKGGNCLGGFLGPCPALRGSVVPEGCGDSGEAARPAGPSQWAWPLSWRDPADGTEPPWPGLPRPPEGSLLGGKDSAPPPGPPLQLQLNSGPGGAPLAGHLVLVCSGFPRKSRGERWRMPRSAGTCGSPGSCLEHAARLPACLTATLLGAILFAGRRGVGGPWRRGCPHASYPHAVSSRAFRTATTLPRWAPASFSRPMTITSPPRLRGQTRRGSAGCGARCAPTRSRQQ